MFADDKNLKDTSKDSLKDTTSMPIPYKKTDLLSNSYPKLKKLITALYIVTDIMDKDEPIRLKLRTFGVEILSDINSVSRTELNQKVKNILSFLDIASTISLISEMNFNILKKEFIELSESLEEKKESNQSGHTWLEEFLKPNEPVEQVGLRLPKTHENKKNLTFINKDDNSSSISRKQRRDGIIQAIRDNGGNGTIADVKIKTSGQLSTSEKTLQRELVSMVQEGILSKTGEKRWSRYFLKSNP
ncbi:MAG: hypothetical protein KGL67_00090 [Patescibacteria group bacterium]|nr:hypothetical protein [Patescibacteria group bacterium]